MAPVVEVISERLTLGEGPHWDVETQSLYYIDIFGQTLYKHTPSTSTTTKVKIEGGPLSFAIPVAGTADKFLVALGRKLAVVTWDGLSSSPSSVKVLREVENECGLTGNRFNDGKADPSGRLWAGTMGPEPEIGKLEPEKGALYTLNESGELTKHLSKVSISNGLAWNVKLNKQYYIDSPLRTIDEYDFDIQKGTIKNKRVVFDLEKHGIPGVPDGMTIDNDGNLWVAVFNGGRIFKVDPRSSQLITTIDLPAQQVTSAAFGGPSMDVLYVTSAQLVIEGVPAAEPAGAVFKITGIGAKGLPGVKVKLNV